MSGDGIGWALFNASPDVLAHYCAVNWHQLPGADRPFTVPGVPHLRLTAVPLASKAPPYSPHRAAPEPGDTIGVRIEDLRTGKKVFMIESLATRQLR